MAAMICAGVVVSAVRDQRAGLIDEFRSPGQPPWVAAFRVRRLQFLPDVIGPAVRWYLRFGLSYCEVEELLAECGIESTM
jgi:hypothetical protein